MTEVLKDKPPFPELMPHSYSDEDWQEWEDSIDRYDEWASAVQKRLNASWLQRFIARFQKSDQK